jgi:hypothetical protein
MKAEQLNKFWNQKGFLNALRPWNLSLGRNHNTMALDHTFHFDDNTIIISKIMSRIIIFFWQDMGMVNISRKMLKNPPVDKKTKNNV